MARRLEVAHRELKQAHRYRHRVVNDDVGAAVGQIERILFSAGLPGRPHPVSTPSSAVTPPNTDTPPDTAAESRPRGART
jgi:hypothetical protein